MGAPTFEGEAGRVAIAQSNGLVDFLVHKVKAERLTYREVALQSGMSKSRVHRTLHPDRCKRLPLRIDEYHQVLTALGTTQMEASIGAELIAEKTISPSDMDKLLELVTGICAGLHTALADVVEHIEGLDWDDIRSYHGSHFQARIIAEVRQVYGQMSERRELRRMQSETE